MQLINYLLYVNVSLLFVKQHCVAQRQHHYYLDPPQSDVLFVHADSTVAESIAEVTALQCTQRRDHLRRQMDLFAACRRCA